MRLPDFLIIGAMKAGTTSLYRDLQLNEALCLPADKEPGCLVRDVPAEDARRAYSRHFRKARAGQLCGEASTGYTKLPDYPGVPGRAREVLGPGARMIYLVREPVARIISHHHHETTSGRIECGIDEAVRRYPRFVEYSRYAMQVEPWLKTFGPEQVLIVRFESYVADRRGWVEAVSRFLGVEPRCEAIRVERVHNPSAAKPVPRGPMAALRSTALYRRAVRPLLSGSIRERLRRLLLPRAAEAPQLPSPATVDYLIERLREDVDKLQGIMGLEQPPWDLDEVAAHYATDHSPRHADSAC